MAETKKVSLTGADVQTTIKTLTTIYGDMSAINEIVNCGGNLHARIVDGVLANTIRYLMKLRDHNVGGD